jgi:uncharacterized protein YfdQ (DUF2303 family)
VNLPSLLDSHARRKAARSFTQPPKEGTASKGKLQVPQVFTIGIPVFEGGARYAVDARLRYRIAEGGKLSLWFDLLRPHKILEDALRELRTVIELRTELQAFSGS